MRKLPLGVAISVIVHAAVLAGVALYWLSGARRAEPSPPPPPPLMTIEVISAPPPVAPLPVALTPIAAASARIARATERPDIPAAPDLPAAPAAPAAPDIPAAPRVILPVAPPAPGPSLLAMRPGEPRVARSAGRFDPLDPVPLGITPEAARHAGYAAGANIDQGGFDAKVAADGTVKLTDKPGVRVALAGKQIIEDYLASDKTLGGPAGDPLNAPRYEAAPGTAINLGSTSASNALPMSAGMSYNGDHKALTLIAPLISGTFDATDSLMRRHGFDPYASRKLALLDATRDQRVALGTRTRTDQLAHATQLMQRNLDAVWTTSTLELAAKKRALFELWDECVEDGDTIAVNGGSDARRLVIDFIRGHLPAGSASAYTPAELAELARHQQSKAAFQPYAR